jgi:CRP-like cAMP-binding protein
MATDRDIAFPVLQPRDVAALGAGGERRDVRAGEVLFAEGDKDVGFFVVLEGEIEILEHSRGSHRRGPPAR